MSLAAPAERRGKRMQRLAGALAWTDFLTIARESGFEAPDLVDHRPLAITDEALIAKLDGLKFISATVELSPAGASSACCKESRRIALLNQARPHPL